MRDLVDLGGFESDCGENRPKAEVRYNAGGWEAHVGNNRLSWFCAMSDDYALTHAQDSAKRWNEQNGLA
jgi:hypothetical protein